MEVPRLLELDEPPEFGLTYLVPSCRVYKGNGPWEEIEDWIPVRPEKHADPELGFFKDHFHVDWRFIPDALLKRILLSPSTFLPPDFNPDKLSMEDMVAHCLRYVLLPCHITEGIEERPQLCTRMYSIPWEYEHKAPERLQALLREPRISKCGTCPHKGMNLAREAPDINGIIHCPGHGLCFRADTGELVPRKEAWAALQGA